MPGVDRDGLLARPADAPGTDESRGRRRAEILEELSPRQVHGVPHKARHITPGPGNTARVRVSKVSGLSAQ
ncbi:hypothetical protein D187_005726 [Cystobacter fuscus DSM 2262]|uniref:Uncharacterized protein n=1 Tax=Cystobacter fuscus (strain ATCC 25194 / DSM 2262 / NBRC 100088 / M29) TaxID=1242864 RepID=S9PG10_CYSF2|nr:hypothetical protein D187_005726 [Cystobacter fuscus DSM 2262]